MTVKEFYIFVKAGNIPENAELRYYTEDPYYDIDPNYVPVNRFEYNKLTNQLRLV